MMRLPLRMAALVRKEMIQYFRDPIMLFLVIYLYTGEVIMCSSALSFDVRDLPTVWADLDGSAPSRLLSERFESSGYFRIVHRVTREEEMKALLDRGAAAVAVVIPPDFSRHLAAGSPAAVQVLLDGSNANSASVAQGYAQRIVREFSLEALDDHAAAHAAPRIEHRPRIWYNSELRSVYSIVLSMIGLAGMLVGVITAAASIVREKESGTIEQIRVTPVTGPELIVAKMLPTLLLGLVSLVPALLIAGWYGVPLRGSLFLFFLFSAVLLLASMGIGILIATYVETLQQALLNSFFLLFPVLFLSGTIVPVQSMPVGFQYIAQLSPLTHYMEATLGIFLKGVGLEVLWPRAAALVAIAAALLGISLVQFRRRFL